MIPGMPGGIEILIILFIILLFFGKRLPSAMFSVGKSITEFKKGMNQPVDEATESSEPQTQQDEPEKVND